MKKSSRENVDRDPRHLPPLVVDDTLKYVSTDPTFVAFYEARGRKIASRVHWVLDCKLPPGILFQASLVNHRDWYIRVPLVPVPSVHASAVAHELLHVELHDKGFKSTHFLSEDANSVSSALNSMLQDPLIEEELHSYGFDIRAPYERELATTLDQIRTIKVLPTGRHGSSLNLFNYTGLALSHRILLKLGLTSGPDPLLAFVRTKFLMLADEMEKLLKLIDRIGFDTPSKMIAVLEEIIRKYDLSA